MKDLRETSTRPSGWGQVLARFFLSLGWLALPLWMAFASRPAIAAPTKLVVGINRDYPPYEYLDAHGQPAGYDVDLLKAVAKVEDLELTFQADTWDRTLQAFQEGKVDVLAGLLRSTSREAFADFSTPHLVVHYSLFIRDGEPRIHGLGDLSGRRVLVERHSQMDEYLQGAGLGLRLLPVASEPEALRKLAAGEGDAAAAPQLEGMVLAKQNHLNLEPVGGPLFTRHLCFAVHKGNPELLARLNTGLAILNQTGQYAEIYQAWFSHLEPGAQISLALVRGTLAVLILGAAILIGAAVWNHSLRHQVNQATDQLRQANEAIRTREAFLDAVIENLPVAIFGKNPEQGYVFTLWNARSEEIFGFSKTEVLGRDDYALFPRDQADFFRAKDEDVIRDRRPLEIPEEKLLSPTRGELLLHTRKVPLFDEAGRPFLLLGISEDITGQRAMEEGLRQAQKLESLGVLAGGIAHDFNNLLTAILGNLGLATLQVDGGHPALPFLQNAEATALRAADLTRQMLAYSGRGVFATQSLDLNQLSEEMVTLLKVSLSKNARLRFDFAPGLPRILADPAQIQQVVMNLVTNASEALGPTGGEILVSTGTRKLDEAQTAHLHPGSPIPPGRYVMLAVRDEGSGMTAEVLSRIFDPFFTTKFSGRGLGLSAMLGILRAHHAGVGIWTEPGTGTEFRLYFPEGEGEAEASPKAQVAARPLRSTTVLLVEDEPEVRQATAAMLRQAGFQVLESTDGKEACDCYVRERSRIGVVLMDLTMPRLDGASAARQILAADPKARIILTSGFPLGEDSGSPGLAELAGFLQKPFQLPDLLEALQGALDPS